MICYYINSKNEKIDFKSDTYRLMSTDLWDSEWEYDKTERGALGTQINSFYKNLKEKELEFMVRGKSNAEYKDALNNLISVIDYDTANNQKGKLYVNDYYIPCNLINVEHEKWERNLTFHPVTVKLVAEKLSWVKPNKFSVQAGDTQISDNDFLDFPFDFEFDFFLNAYNKTFINNAYQDSDFKLTIYGYINNPRITIGSTVYEVMTTVYKGDYLVIDSQNSTVYLHKNNGTVINVFNDRYKTDNIFKKIPIGTNYLNWNGTFSFDLEFYDERSSPIWI